MVARVASPADSVGITDVLTYKVLHRLANAVGITGVLSFRTGPVPLEIQSVLKSSVLSDPSFTPDGTSVIFVEAARATYRISTIAIGATQVQTTLFTSQFPLSDPTYSPDGFYILFAEQTTPPSLTFPYGQSRLRYMLADGTGVVTILDDGNANLHPIWVTPTQVAFQWWSDGATPSTAFHISLVDMAGRGRIDVGVGEYPRMVAL